MAKRKHDEILEEQCGISEDFSNKKQDIPLNVNKHSLDSDEEDSEDEADQVDDKEIEGEEDGETFKEGEVQITPFNMKEELQEGHFDNQGHYHWKKNDKDDVNDHWLDNIDWVKIKETTDGKVQTKEESDDEEPAVFDPTDSYKKMLELMKPNETVLKALSRLGKSSKISSAQRWKNKKMGIVDPNAEHVTNLTSLANEILTRMGDMDVYQETFESITRQIKQSENKKPTSVSELDMYSDDFDEKEKAKISTEPNSSSVVVDNNSSDKNPVDTTSNTIMWEFKWKQNDDDSEIKGPYSSEKMQEWNESGYFKGGVWVRRVGGEGGQFHTSNRIDFELYL